MRPPPSSLEGCGRISGYLTGREVVQPAHDNLAQVPRLGQLEAGRDGAESLEFATEIDEA